MQISENDAEKLRDVIGSIFSFTDNQSNYSAGPPSVYEAALANLRYSAAILYKSLNASSLSYQKLVKFEANLKVFVMKSTDKLEHQKKGEKPTPNDIRQALELVRHLKQKHRA